MAKVQLGGRWTRLLTSERLRRSSQVLSVVDQTVYIFGGEVLPRQPVGSDVDVLVLSPSLDAPQLESKAISPAPSPRIGSASAVLKNRMYLFSGRSGSDMTPVEEGGALWCYDPAHSTWSLVKPANPSRPYPPARSYHCATSDGHNTLFFHAGCPAKGRLSDLWKFDVASRTWTQAPDAPAPPRGGSSIACSDGKLYRMNGFDGIKEQGGSIDVFDISSATWSAISFNADGMEGPEPRSVCALLPLKLLGRSTLINLFGERDPSSLGHSGAGKMLSDVWTYDIAEETWTKLEAKGDNGLPAARGWFDADIIKGQDGKDAIIVHGGLSENNERLSDVWMLSF